MDESISLKAAALIQRKQKRDEENSSVLDSLGLEPVGTPMEMQDVEDVDISTPPAKCPTCNGSKYVKSLFSKWECAECYGTGFDMSNPIAVIKWQSACMDWARDRISRQGAEIKRLKDPRTDEERHAEAVEEFYSDAKIKD
ncbi:hypothetical protein EAF56_20150 [Vibrio alginolyticus]|uniref:hypothetical protein n=1 Tax=Vibrio alginolyticus TaxID=663 RepID=UPI001D98AE27|nr:hypothetical protein [Vibrio alginolyticus]EGR1298301.1 hypothetical protein [Vibrio alginolyticus]MCR9568752.1 hypothetical protein [Vibrio alginolyticus]MCS0281078.1 hypothetical protein [Vibrio alginolyticus]